MDRIQEHLFGLSKDRAVTNAEIEAQCRDIDQLAKTKTSAKAMLPHVLSLVRAAPKDHRPQLLAAHLMERTRQKQDMLDTWTGLHDRFPQLHVALRFMVRWLNRDGQIAEAAELLCTMIDCNAGAYNTIALAELCSEMRDIEHASFLFERLLSSDPQNVSLRVIYGKSLLSRGEIFRAFDILDPISHERLSKTARAVVDRSHRAHDAMNSLGDGDASVLTRTLELFTDRTPRATTPSVLGGICFYTGSLGAGGAERQLTQMASAFHHRRKAGRNIHGTRIEGVVEVVVNNLDKNRGKNFFVPALKASGVPLTVTSDMPKDPIEQLFPENPHLSHLLPHLPANVRYGLERLTRHFRETSPDVAYFWQDGAVLNSETQGASFTLGSVFRFNPNKRGLLWLDYARLILNTHPNARFVMVGDGEELAKAQQKASDLNIERRVLFVGNSQNPGFWLSKMDAMCLLSENEGLPNVLIEAQIAGIPVISTPAGGASETFLDTQTGYLLSSAIDPSEHEFLMYAQSLIGDVPLRRSMGDKGRAQVASKFEREAVFSQTIRFFQGEYVAGDKEQSSDAKITKLTPKKPKTTFDPRVQAAYNVVAKL